MLDVKSTTKGALLPRLTQTQIEAITSPANGLVVFCTTDEKFYAFRQTDNEWKEIAFGTGSIIPTVFNSITGKTWMDRNLGFSMSSASIYYNSRAYGFNVRCIKD